MEECVECAKEFGERLAMELGVPGKLVYLIFLGKMKSHHGK